MCLPTGSNAINAAPFMFMEDLFSRLTDLNNLHKAYLNCRKQVDWKESVQRYGLNEFVNIINLKKALENGTYRQKPFYEFDICERGKKRHIKALHISDRVLQRALCDEILNPVLQKYLIYDNGASVKGKGIDFTRRRVKVLLSRYYRKYGNKGYVLKIDFSKYFDNIPHDIVLKKIGDKIKDERVMNLLGDLISSFGEEKSLGIGSQISQIAGLFYPSEMDNYFKIVKRKKFYIRYQDDTIIMARTKQELVEDLHDLMTICSRLKIIINKKKTQILRLEKGFKFLKIRYILKDSGKIIEIPEKDRFTRERHKLKKLKNRLDEKEMRSQFKSWEGPLRKYKCHNRLRRIEEYVERNCFESGGHQKTVTKHFGMTEDNYDKK